jgi:hypothetical protein
VLFSGSCIIKGEIKKSVREQRKRRIRPLDIVSVCHEISSNKRKVFDEIRKVFRFSPSSGGRESRR